MKTFSQRAQRAGEQDAGQQHQRAEQEGHLHHRAPAAAEEAQVVAGRAPSQQVERRAEHRGRVEHRRGATPRCRVDQFGLRAADTAISGTASALTMPRAAQISAFSARNSMRVAVQVKIVGEHAADAQAGELDRPALLRRLVAVQLLDQQHADHGQARRGRRSWP